MNKLILINIMKNIISLYLKNELNEETFSQVTNNLEKITATENEIAYNEASFISYLFENITYYKLMSSLNGLIITLNTLDINSKQKCIKDLIEAYLSDLLPIITGRLVTEINAHIQEIIILFYQRDNLPYQDTIKRLKRNIINPSYLASMDTAEQMTYTQETISNFALPKEETLRESISRTNFNKKNSIERNTTKLFTNYFNEELYQKLIESLKELIYTYSLENSTDADLLKDELLPILYNLHQKAKKKWNEQKPIDENQLTLIFQ